MTSDQDDEKAVSVEIRMMIPQLDAFHRAEPPGAHGTQALWRFGPQLIDFGNALFASHNNVRTDRATRDIVMAALFRRALITAESVMNLLYHGLPESALVLLRTLLDIEVNAKLIHLDSTDKTAKRLGAYHYFAGQRHGQKMAGDSETRDKLKDEQGAFDEHLNTVRKYAAWFESAGFDDVRDEIRPGQPWHGFNSAEEAFRSVGNTTDYFNTYDLGTFFVHATNLDFDFSEMIEGKVMLKAPLTTEEDRLVTILGLTLAHLHAVMKVFASDKPIREDQGDLIVDGQHKEPISAVDAMGILLGQALPDVSGLKG